MDSRNSGRELLDVLASLWPLERNPEDLVPIVQRMEPGLRACIHDALNVLMWSTPEFFETVARARLPLERSIRERGLPVLTSSGVHHVNRVSYRVAYCLRLPPLPPEASVRLFVPWLRQTAAQSGPTLVSCTPEWLRPFADPILGMLYGARGPASELATIELVADVTVAEAHLQFGDLKDDRAGDLSPMDAEWLVSDFPVPDALAALAKELASEHRGTLGRARAAYQWILDHVVAGWCDLGRPSSLEYALSDGLCSDQTAAELFVGLCRGMGIAARPQVGILFHPTNERGRFVARGLGPQRFLHYWAEFLLPDIGWIPVDTVAAFRWRGSMTEENVLDPVLRGEMDELGAFFEHYYFGHLDNVRVHSGAVPSGGVIEIRHAGVESTAYVPWQATKETLEVVAR